MDSEAVQDRAVVGAELVGGVLFGDGDPVHGVAPWCGVVDESLSLRMLGDCYQRSISV